MEIVRFDGCDVYYGACAGDGVSNDGFASNFLGAEFVTFLYGSAVHTLGSQILAKAKRFPKVRICGMIASNGDAQLDR